MRLGYRVNYTQYGFPRHTNHVANIEIHFNENTDSAPDVMKKIENTIVEEYTGGGSIEIQQVSFLFQI